MMICPICNTKTHDTKKCTQCDSDLEIYTILENAVKEPGAETLQISTAKLIPRKKNSAFTLQNIKIVLFILMLPFLGYLIFLSVDFRNSMLSEMKMEREDHRTAQERALQWTEKLIEKQGQVYSDTMTKLIQLNDEQKNSLTTIEARLIKLEKENSDLVNMVKQANKTKKRFLNNGK